MTFDGYHSLQELIEANQLLLSEHVEQDILRDAKDVALTSRFPIQSAGILYASGRWKASPTRRWYQICIQVYNKPLSAERTLPDTDIFGQSSIVLYKDLRVDSSGNPVNPETYRRWAEDKDGKLKSFEAEEERIPQNKDGASCFIATAVYGDINAPEVQVLRHFRDSYMVHTPLGRWLVGRYYAVSPPIAVVIQRHQALRAVGKACLNAFIFTISKVGKDAVFLHRKLPSER